MNDEDEKSICPHSQKTENSVWTSFLTIELIIIAGIALLGYIGGLFGWWK